MQRDDLTTKDIGYVHPNPFLEKYSSPEQTISRTTLS